MKIIEKDTAEARKKKNAYCKLEDLSNEASVESFFINRLLKDLGFKDSQIKTKESLKKLKVFEGSKSKFYKPDYCIVLNKKPKFLIDAKSIEENIEDYVGQCAFYALMLNRSDNTKPLEYFILSNGLKTALFKWDSDKPLMELDFSDFQPGNENFKKFSSYIEDIKKSKKTVHSLKLMKLPVNDLKELFQKCHDKIWKKEKIGPTKAFYEFSKMIFVKMKEDRKIIDRINRNETLTQDDLIFSVNWIERNEKAGSNPFNDILFKQIREDLEEEIIKRHKKRIFNVNDGLNLRPTTIKEVVRMLQDYDLHSIDEDLNGRMFETFLNATVRGKELGQFFTPRQVVKYMVNLAFLIGSDAINKTFLDGCCGSGGFLIEVMAVAINKINKNGNLTDEEKKKIIDDIKNNHLYGIEANSEIAAIARMNMYLHGDGGSNIFSADTLDKEIDMEEGDNSEKKRDMAQLKELLLNEKKKFDIVLTNPPFSMKYTKQDNNEKRILNSYEIGKLSNSIKSNILFIERYLDLLVDNGMLITIIDDSILNSQNDRKFLNYIKNKFIIKQVISLPFNTFKNAGTSTKTSILVLKKKNNETENQADIFMAICNNVGHDDFGRETMERNNLPIVFGEYKKYINPKSQSQINRIINNDIKGDTLTAPLQIFTLKSNKLKTRLDAFYYSPELKRLKIRMDKLVKVGKLEYIDKYKFDIVGSIGSEQFNKLKNKRFKYIEVGSVDNKGSISNIQEEKLVNLPTRAKKLVKKGDVIIAKSISCIGSNTIIPDYLDGQFVSTGFIVLRPKNINEDYLESYILWTYLNTEYVKKQFYYKSTTAVQPEINEQIFINDIFIPMHNNIDRKKQVLIEVRKIIRIKDESPVDKIKEILKFAEL